MAEIADDLAGTILPDQKYLSDRLGPVPAQPQAEARSYTPPPSQRVRGYIQDGLSALGMPLPNAQHLAEGLSGLIGMTPAGIPLAAGDASYYAGHGEPLPAAIAAAGVIPALKGAGKAAKAASTGENLAEAVLPKGAMPQVAERYPAVAPPVEAIDKVKGTPYLQKQLSPEAESVQKLRIAAQRDIDAGNYTPHFDPAQRFDADPSNYPPVQSTLDLVMKKPETRAKYDAVTMSPETAARLDAAFQQGQKQAGGAGNWYQMGQLENEFIKEYGAKEGPRLFKERFADAMAATTGGADPTSNLMMAHYGNYLRGRGEPVPAASYEYPFPVGGRYAATNMDQYRKMLMEGAGVTALNPKRYNFSANFLGNKSGSTIDEQMMGLIEPGKANPPPAAYGHYEAPVAAQAAKAGVDPRYYQEVAWAGAKDAKTKGGYAAKPMIGIVNEAIERTHRITGMPREEIVRRGLVRGEIPLYGAGAVGLGSALSAGMQDDQPQGGS